MKVSGLIHRCRNVGGCGGMCRCIRALAFSVTIVMSLAGPLRAADNVDKQGDILYQRLLDAPEQILGSADSSMAESLQKWARYYEARQDLQRAEIFQQAVLIVKRKLYSADSSHIHRAEQWLAELQLRRQPAPVEVVVTDPSEKTATDQERVNQLFIEAEGLHRAGKVTEAFQKHIQVLLSVDESVPGNQRMIAVSLYRTGSVHFDLNNYEQAHVALSRAALIMEQLESKNQLLYSDVLVKWGTVLHLRGEPHLADAMLTKALEIKTQVLGVENPEMLGYLSVYATWKQTYGDYDKAEQAYKLLLAAYTRTHDVNRPEIARTLKGLGDVYMHKQLYHKAENAYLKSLKIYEKHNDNKLFDIVRAVARLYYHQQDYIRAEPFYSRAVKLQQRGQTEGLTLEDRFSLLTESARTALELDQKEIAERFIYRAIAMNDEFYKGDPTLAIDGVIREMDILFDLKKHDDIIRLAHLVLSRPESSQGEMEIRRGAAYMSMGLAQFQKYNYKAARKALNQAAEIYSRVLPASVVHVETLLAKVDLMDGLVTASDFPDKQ